VKQPRRLSINGAARLAITTNNSQKDSPVNISPVGLRAVLFVVGVVLLTANHTATAAPLRYLFTATYQDELSVVGTAPGSSVDIGDRWLGAGLEISGSFLYDSNTPIYDIPPRACQPQYNECSLYVPSILELSAQVGGYSISAAYSYSLLYNRGDAAANSLVHATVSVLNIDLVISGWTPNNAVFASSIEGQLSGQGLPATPNPNGTLDLFALQFFDAEYNQHVIVFDHLEIQAVPLPASGMLFGCGLLGLTFSRRKLFIDEK
jgi:hypothetical protein